MLIKLDIGLQTSAPGLGELPWDFFRRTKIRSELFHSHAMVSGITEEKYNVKRKNEHRTGVKCYTSVHKQER